MIPKKIGMVIMVVAVLILVVYVVPLSLIGFDAVDITMPSTGHKVGTVEYNSDTLGDNFIEYGQEIEGELYSTVSVIPNNLYEYVGVELTAVKLFIDLPEGYSGPPSPVNAVSFTPVTGSSFTNYLTTSSETKTVQITANFIIPSQYTSSTISASVWYVFNVLTDDSSFTQTIEQTTVKTAEGTIELKASSDDPPVDGTLGSMIVYCGQDTSVHITGPYTETKNSGTADNVKFIDIPTGAYTITLSRAGYHDRTFAETVIADDWVNVYGTDGSWTVVDDPNPEDDDGGDDGNGDDGSDDGDDDDYEGIDETSLYIVLGGLIAAGIIVAAPTPIPPKFRMIAAAAVAVVAIVIAYYMNNGGI